MIRFFLISDTINEIVRNYMLIYPNLKIYNEIDAKDAIHLGYSRRAVSENM